MYIRILIERLLTINNYLKKIIHGVMIKKKLGYLMNGPKNTETITGYSIDLL
jgi:hypothetical protein